jgi:hypothetical protein
MVICPLGLSLTSAMGDHASIQLGHNAQSATFLPAMARPAQASTVPAPGRPTRPPAAGAATPERLLTPADTTAPIGGDREC